jgi:hypothetical protein
MRKRERNVVPKSNALTSGSPVADPKSGPDYSLLSQNNIFFSNFTYSVRCFSYSGVRVPQFQYHCCKEYRSRPLSVNLMIRVESGNYGVMLQECEFRL